MRRPKKFEKSPPYFWLALQRTKVTWEFCKILWPSQNIWTLPDCLKNSDRKRRVDCLLPWILKNLNSREQNCHDELQSRGISRPRKKYWKKWLMESLEPYDGRSAVCAFWRRFRKAAPCSSKDQGADPNVWSICRQE